MKKFLLTAVVVVLLVALTASFAACGSDPAKNEITQLTYVDQEGKTVNVSLQETDKPEEVADVLVAISEQENGQDLVRSMLASVQASFSGSVSQGDVTQRVDLTAILDAGLNLPTVNEDSTIVGLLNEAAPYLSLSLTGNFPLDASSVGAQNDVRLDESAQVYYAGSTMYAKVNLSNDLKTSLGIADEAKGKGALDLGGQIGAGIGGAMDALIGGNVSTMLDGYLKLSLGEMFAEMDEDVDMAQVKEALDKIAQNDPIDVIVSLGVNEESATFSTHDFIQQMVEELNVVITEVKDNKVSFRMTVSQELAQSLTELSEQDGIGGGLIDMEDVRSALASYDGSSTATITFDAQSKRFVALEIEAKALLNCLLSVDNDIFAQSVNLDKATFKIALQYNQEIPTIADSDKASAKDMSSLLMMLMGLLG